MEEQRNKHKVSSTNSNFYKFRGQQEGLNHHVSADERPKSSKGGLRSTSSGVPSRTTTGNKVDRMRQTVSNKLSHGGSSQTNLREDKLKSSALTKKNVRPSSTGISKGVVKRSQVGIQAPGTSHGHATMYDKNGNHHDTSPNKDPGMLDRKFITHLAPSSRGAKLVHAQDPLSGQQPTLAQHAKMLQSATSKDPSANPQAYDELKKRLLNEYKKLCNTKKAHEEPRFTPQASKPQSQNQSRIFESEE